MEELCGCLECRSASCLAAPAPFPSTHPSLAQVSLPHPPPPSLLQGTRPPTRSSEQQLHAPLPTQYPAFPPRPARSPRVQLAAPMGHEWWPPPLHSSCCCVPELLLDAFLLAERTLPRYSTAHWCLVLSVHDVKWKKS